MNTVILVIARILMALVFVLAGLGKLGAGYATTQAYMASMGTPGMLLPLVIALEIGGGLALILGFFTRWAALALAGFSIVGALIFHHDFADQTQMIMFMKDFAMAGGLLLLFVYGAGSFSIDANKR
ncbi:DoxX family protein [Crenothrix polyspora]|jgi:putative oxidoreductase|uniref:Putative quinol oxidase subunit n=1 Tax=Crenothrix polyspora TaxID=360316 RepID=A0A1R4HJQ7_9GAMM|nr:DoxX family protein [Crenothrix polyspora]SJM96130.1 putative quinol oxidase subunit [Crenothrix polyspora]